jgi:hypothetical protein
MAKGRGDPGPPDRHRARERTDVESGPPDVLEAGDEGEAQLVAANPHDQQR